MSTDPRRAVENLICLQEKQTMVGVKLPLRQNPKD